MNKKIFTPEESLLLIAQTIEETKQRFKNNGHIIIFWGFLTFMVTLSQFILLQLELYRINLYPCYLYPLGGIYTALYLWRKNQGNPQPQTPIGRILMATGGALGLNLLLLGFIFSDKLGEAMASVFLILLAFFLIVCGVSIKFKPLIVGGILLNLIGFAAFYFDSTYHPLIMSIGSVTGLIIPGILLNKNK